MWPLPLHDDEQALLPMMHVLIQAEDTDDVRPSGHPPVELHLSSGFGAVVQDLGQRDNEYNWNLILQHDGTDELNTLVSISNLVSYSSFPSLSGTTSRLYHHAIGSVIQVHDTFKVI